MTDKQKMAVKIFGGIVIIAIIVTVLFYGDIASIHIND